MSNLEKLVLGTVNAPFKHKCSSEELTAGLKGHSNAASLPHLAAFFGDVSPSLQKEFAALHGISDDKLISACNAVAEKSGEDYPLIAV